MLQSIRDNSQSIVAKIIVGLIIITFALFGVESLVSLTSGSQAPATVNGEEISEQELYQATELQRRQLLAQMGENADPTLLDDNLIQSMVLNSLIEQKTLLQSAENQGMTISDAMVDQQIIATPDFQVDGRFNPEQFEAVLRNAGFTPLMYRDLLKKERLLEQQRTGYQLSGFVLPGQLKRMAELDRQTRSASYFTLPFSQFKAQIQPTNEELQAAYAARRDSLLTDEQVIVEYLLLDKQSLESEVDIRQEDIKAAYDQLLAGFEADEQRRVAHILVEITPEQDEAAALAKVTALQERLLAGESFTELAKAESDDLGSAAAGGDLGLNGKGVFDTAFETAMFELPVDTLSEPVKTDFGYHLMRVSEVKKTEPPTFEQAKERLKAELLAGKIESIYVERLEQLADSSFSAGDLAEPADVMGLPIQTSQPFSRSGGSDDITSNNKVITAAFGAELINEGLNSSLIELDRNRTLVLRVKEHLPPREQTFDEVAENLKVTLVDEQAEARIAAKADEILVKLREQGDLQQVAQGQEIAKVTDISRAATELPQQVRNRVFALPKPESDKVEYAKVDLDDGSIAIIALTGVNTPEVDLTEAEVRSMGGFMGSLVGQQEYQALMGSLRNQAEVEKL